MTRKNSPDRAFREYLDPLEQALGCIAPERLTAMSTRPRSVGPVYSILLNDNQPVSLKGLTALRFSAGQLCRITEDTTADDGPYRVQQVNYWYVLSNLENREILAFHWTPEANPTAAKTTPHLHVGSVNISESAPLPAKTFNKLHIPTGDVSLQSVVRFLIEEVGVVPRRANWADVLSLEP